MKINKIRNVIDRHFENETDDNIRSAYLSTVWFSKNYAQRRLQISALLRTPGVKIACREGASSNFSVTPISDVDDMISARKFKRLIYL